MAHIDPSAREVVAQIVYYGAPLAGKTTNLQRIYGALATEKGPLVPFASGSGRSLLFDFVPPGVALLHGMKMRIQLCTVDGPVAAEPSRRALLRDADALVLIVDSQAAGVDPARRCLESLERILLGERPELPVVLQYNKRDLPTALSQEALNARLNPRGWPALEAIAPQGIGVAETLRVAIRHCHKALAALDAASLSPSTPGRRHAVRLPAPESAPLPTAADAEATQPLRRPTASSLAADPLVSAAGKRYPTLSAMSRDAFAAAARRYDTIPATAREDLERPQDRHATLPVTQRDELERAKRRRDTVAVAPPPAAKPAPDDEETRPLRLSTAKSLARESLEAARPTEEAPAAPEPLEPPPPSDQAKSAASPAHAVPAAAEGPEPTPRKDGDAR